MDVVWDEAALFYARVRGGGKESREVVFLCVMGARRRFCVEGGRCVGRGVLGRLGAYIFMCKVLKTACINIFSV